MKELCSKGFDLVWVARLSGIRMLPHNAGARVIVDLDDIEHRKLQWLLRVGHVDHMTPLLWLEFLKFRRIEARLSELPFEFVICSEYDRQHLGSSMPVWVIPNGAEIPDDEGLRFCEEEGGPTLVFTGAMGYGPNVDAVIFFSKHVLPLIRREFPNVRFFIVGHGPVQKVRQLADGLTTIVTGAVPSVADYLRRASVFVAPLRFGGGTRIKILEAMAYRTAVVSTTIGAEGLELEPGRHLLLADTPREFAGACISLLKNISLRRRLAEEAFELVSTYYRWSSIEELVTQIATSESTRPPFACEASAST